MENEIIIHQSVRGESHIQRGTPKEDAADCGRFGDRIIGIVSDGHGDRRCMRSEIGSRMAVEITMEILKEWDMQAAFETDGLFEDQIHILARKIIEGWTQAVTAHFQENPLTEMELKEAGNLLGFYQKGEKISHIYGATLIAFLQMQDKLLLLQKGDGHAFVINRQGETEDDVISWDIIPWDSRCLLNVTTSLCDDDAADSFTWRLITGSELENIAAVMIGSDGVEDSFPNLEMAGTYYGTLAVACAENGAEETERALEQDLAKMSRNGSNDDISIAGLVYADRILPLKHLLETKKEIGELNLKRESLKSRISSMNSAFSRREQIVHENEEKLKRYQSETIEKEDQMEKLEQQIEMLEHQQLPPLKLSRDQMGLLLDERKSEEKKLQREVDESIQAYNDYKEKLDAKKKEYDELCDQIKTLKSSSFENEENG